MPEVRVGGKPDPGHECIVCYGTHRQGNPLAPHDHHEGNLPAAG